MDAEVNVENCQVESPEDASVFEKVPEMEEKINVEICEEVPPVEVCTLESPSENLPMLDRQGLRRKRIDDFRDEGLSRPAAGEACLASVSADLYGIATGLGQVINQSLTESSPTLETIGQLEPTLNNYLRVARQIERLTSFQAKMTAESRRAREMKLQLQILAERGPLERAARQRTPSF